MRDVFLVDGLRTPIGRFSGALSGIRTDDLAALPITALMQKHTQIDWAQVDDVMLGCANQAGEDNRNVARMAVLLSGLPVSVPGVTVNRLCASGMEAVIQAARAVALGDAELIIAGGVESMSRAPYVLSKTASAFGREQKLEDSVLGWRFINARIEAQYGVESLTQTAENLALQYGITRADQDAFALRSQQRYARANAEHFFGDELISVSNAVSRAAVQNVVCDEHPRADTSLERLQQLKPLQVAGTVTAGNASGVNDGACALLIASAECVAKYALTPLARISASAHCGVAPGVMGIGPVPATQKLLARLNLTLNDFAHIEINEAFAAQVLACLRALQIADDDIRVNANGGAIALGHPLGMSGARLVLTAARQLQRSKQARALCSLCVGVGQGVSLALERA